MVTSLDELDVERKKKKISRKLEKENEIITCLKVQVEESKIISRDLEAQLTLKIEYSNKLEAEIKGLSM